MKISLTVHSQKREFLITLTAEGGLIIHGLDVHMLAPTLPLRHYTEDRSQRARRVRYRRSVLNRRQW
jgi:hypothetical protein